MSRGKGVSILSRILVAFLLVNVTTSVAIIFVAYSFSTKSIEHRAKESISQQVAIIGDRFDEEFRTDLDRSLRWLTAASPIDDYLFESTSERLVTTKKLEHLFRRTVKDFRSYRSVSFANVDGRVAVTSPRRHGGLAGASLKGGRATESNQTLDAMTTLYQDMASTPLLLSSGNMEWFMPPRQIQASQPFVDDDGTISLVAGLAKLDLDTGTFGGVVFITLSLDEFLGYLSRVRFFDANPIWVLGADGQVLSAPADPAASFDPRSVLPSNYASDLVLTRIPEGMVAYQDFSIVPGQPIMRIAISVPSTLLVKDLSPAISFFSVVLLSSIVVVLLVSLYTSRYLSRPIVELAAAAANMARGDLNTTVAVRTTGEVQTLVSSFNKMTKELRETIAARDASVSSLTSEVSERKRAEEALKRHAEELSKATAAAESADRAKSEFLATMSHEIRTPINGVLGMTELLLNAELNSRQMRLALSVQRSGRALLNIVNDVLDFSKIEAGKLELEHAPFDLRVLVEDVVDMFAESAFGKGVELVGLLEADTHTALIGDVGRLQQVLMNLVGNSVKFTEQGEVVVAVTSIDRDGDSGRVTIEVRDTGIGIPDAAQARIFDAFSQADGSTTRRFGGTGLGLSICKQLVELMGGDIGVTSVSGQGSTFAFTVAVQWDEFPQPELPSPELAGLRVLVADDNASCRWLLASHLAAWHAVCHCVTDGAMALEDLGTAAENGRPFDIAVLDLQMPTMTGLEVAARIKATPTLAGTAVALLGTVNQDFAEERAAAEIDLCLGKPVRKAELHESLVSLLRDKTAKGTSISPEVPTARAGLQGHILVADDNAVNREMAQGMVELLGCSVQTVPDGQAAVLAYRSQEFDAILMDCQMPGMDGYEATRQIRCHEAAHHTGERVPIIALTANVFKGQRQKCLDSDMDDFLAKPFALENLRSTLLNWLAAASVESTDDRPGDSRGEISGNQAVTAEIGKHQFTRRFAELDPKAIANLRALQRDGAESVIIKFSRVFEETSNELLVRLRLGMEQDDAGEVNAAAHSLKTSAANLGARDLAALARELEELARDGDLVAARPVFTQMQSAYLEARAALNALCEREAVAS